MKTLRVSYDEASGFWTGRPWLVIAEEGEPAVASFKTEAEAVQYVKDETPSLFIQSLVELDRAIHDSPPEPERGDDYAECHSHR